MDTGDELPLLDGAEPEPRDHEPSRPEEKGEEQIDTNGKRSSDSSGATGGAGSNPIWARHEGDDDAQNQEGEEPRSTATPPAEQDQPPPAAVLLDSPTEGSVSAAAVPSTPTGRSTRSRSRRKAAKPKCSAGGDDEVSSTTTDEARAAPPDEDDSMLMALLTHPSTPPPPLHDSAPPPPAPPQETHSNQNASLIDLLRSGSESSSAAQQLAEMARVRGGGDDDGVGSGGGGAGASRVAAAIQERRSASPAATKSPIPGGKLVNLLAQGKDATSGGDSSSHSSSSSPGGASKLASLLRFEDNPQHAHAERAKLTQASVAPATSPGNRGLSSTESEAMTKTVLLSFLHQKRKPTQDIPVGTITPQVHGGASHTRSAHSLLASQFLLVTDTDADSKVVTCAICMEIFLAVKKAIDHLQKSHLILVDVNDLEPDDVTVVTSPERGGARGALRDLTEDERAVLRCNFRTSVDNLIESAVREGDSGSENEAGGTRSGGAGVKDEPTEDDEESDPSQGSILKIKFPRVAPVTGTPRPAATSPAASAASLGTPLHVDAQCDPSPTLSATSSESTSPIPSVSQSRRKQKAPRRMTEPSEVEPLVIEPRPELLQSAAPIRGQNKPTTICLICGHVLFKKDTENCHDIFARPSDSSETQRASRVSKVLQKSLSVKAVASRYACSDCLKKVERIEEADALREQLQAQFSHVESLHQPAVQPEPAVSPKRLAPSRLHRGSNKPASATGSSETNDDEWTKTVEAAQRAALQRSQATSPVAAAHIARSLAQAAIAQQMQALRGGDVDPVKDTTTQQAQQVAQFVAQLQTMTVAAAASTHGGAGGAGLHSAFPWPLPSPAMATSAKRRRKGSGTGDVDADWVPGGRKQPPGVAPLGGAGDPPTKRKPRRTKSRGFSGIDTSTEDALRAHFITAPTATRTTPSKPEVVSMASDHRTLRTILSSSSTSSSGPPTPRTPQISSTISSPPVRKGNEAIKPEPTWDQNQYGGAAPGATDADTCGNDDSTASKTHSPSSFELKDSMTLKNVELSDVPPLVTKLRHAGPGIPEFKCRRCNSSFFVYEAIEMHLQCHLTEGNQLRCYLCGYHNSKLAMQWRIMRHHLETSHGVDGLLFAKHRCEIQGCPELFKSTNEYEHHLQKVHASTGGPLAVHAAAQGGALLGGAGPHVLLPNGLFDYGCPYCKTPHFKREALDLHIRCHVGQGKNFACFLCNYMHKSQPGSWRFIRGHMQREHPELATQEIFSYFECEHYTCRVKFCSKRARDIHEMCHDDARDMQFYCFQCGYRALDSNSAFMWEPIKDHIIKQHPQVFEGEFNCSCLRVFPTYADYVDHVNSSVDVEAGDGAF